MDSQELPELFDVVVIQVTGAIFAIDASEVRRVVLLNDPREVQAIPLAGRALLGMAVVGGAPLPVIDLEEVIAASGVYKSPETEAKHPPLEGFPTLGIVCHANDESVLLVGGQVRTTGRLRSADDEAFHWTGIAKRGVEWRGRTIAVLSIPRVLTLVSEPRKSR